MGFLVLKQLKTAKAHVYNRGNRSEWRPPFQRVSCRSDEENRMIEAGNVRYEYTETGSVHGEIACTFPDTYG